VVVAGLIFDDDLLWRSIRISGLIGPAIGYFSCRQIAEYGLFRPIHCSDSSSSRRNSTAAAAS